MKITDESLGAAMVAAPIEAAERYLDGVDWQQDVDLDATWPNGPLSVSACAALAGNIIMPGFCRFNRNRQSVQGLGAVTLRQVNLSNGQSHRAHRKGHEPLSPASQLGDLRFPVFAWEWPERSLAAFVQKPGRRSTQILEIIADQGGLRSTLYTPDPKVFSRLDDPSTPAASGSITEFFMQRNEDGLGSLPIGEAIDLSDSQQAAFITAIKNATAFVVPDHVVTPPPRSRQLRHLQVLR